jgi:light-regulated signal transduction histidine kinase (bacteriophytochrome)
VSFEEPQYLSELTHDLKSALNTVLGFTSLLQESAVDRLTPEERGFLDAIAAAGAEIRMVAEELAALRRAGEPVLQAVDLSESIGSASWEPVMVSADPDLLRRMWNLLIPSAQEVECSPARLVVLKGDFPSRTVGLCEWLAERQGAKLTNSPGVVTITFAEP